MKKLKQLFCKHTYEEITTEPNLRAGVRHGECKKCEHVVTFWHLKPDRYIKSE